MLARIVGRACRSVVDPAHISSEDSPEERLRATRLKKLLAEKDPKVELEIAVRRAMAVLAQCGTPEARDVLRELANRDPVGDVSRLASAALAQMPAP